PPKKPVCERKLKHVFAPNRKLSAAQKKKRDVKPRPKRRLALLRKLVLERKSRRAWKQNRKRNSAQKKKLRCLLPRKQNATQKKSTSAVNQRSAAGLKNHNWQLNRKR